MSVTSSDYKPSGSQSRPQIRSIARFFDFFLFSIAVAFIIEFIYPPAHNISNNAFWIIMILFNIFVEPILLCSWGTTPGKALLKIRVRQQNGAKLSYLQALKRTFLVWTAGLAFGIPVISLFTLLVFSRSLTKEGITIWDRQGNFSVSHQKIGMARGIVIAFLLIACFSLIILGNIES